MIKVITYGTYDLLHQGHLNLLERAKELGDYLIVGVTTRNFDIERGKLNVKQSLMKRIKAIEETGLADEIIIEEYSGQKIDDIKEYGIDIFAVGSDWTGTFDYLNEYCKVVYLERTRGISSSKLRTQQNLMNLGVYTNSLNAIKVIDEMKYINGLHLQSVYSSHTELINYFSKKDLYTDYDEMLAHCDAVLVDVAPKEKYNIIRKCLEKRKHVLTESPISLTEEDVAFLYNLADKNNCILFDTLKTGYTIAFNRAMLLAKGGELGDIKDISVSCTSLTPKSDWVLDPNQGGSITAWGAYVLLPIFRLFGSDFLDICFDSIIGKNGIDELTKINFKYKDKLATAKVGIGVKSEGDLVISGTKGYIYVPSPWWKTEYFELRFEDFNMNRRLFYKLEGEGIRNSLSTFMKMCQEEMMIADVDRNFSIFVSKIFNKFYIKKISGDRYEE